MATIKYEATRLRGRQWSVRPVGQLGTCGWHPVPWTVQYVTAKSALEALLKAALARRERRDSNGNG